MLNQGLMIAGLGMGGVFFFLFILMCFMNLLQFLKGANTDTVKIAVAIAVALNNEQKNRKEN